VQVEIGICTQENLQVKTIVKSHCNHFNNEAFIESLTNIIFVCQNQDLPSDGTWSEKQYQDALNFYDELMNCEDSYVSPFIREALHCLEGAYRIYGPK